MLRALFDEDGNDTLFVRLEGRLVGAYAEEVRITITSHPVPEMVVVDLTEVSFIDTSGEKMLSWLGSMGAEFVAENVYAQAICEQLGLRNRKQT